MKVERLSSLYSGHFYPTGNIPVLIETELTSIKNSNESIGNRFRDLLACIAVPKLTARAREHRCECTIFKKLVFA
jgi:hypothetical protein